ncbi:MAG: hypothetical protein IJ111_15635 [Eggerthellaceae bacterium]|nr:hypothetical protein [Eggerthellaceae bacterium]MBQ9044233.1 hypothetical protein [Eggerthellaceae bacterium]
MLSFRHALEWLNDSSSLEVGEPPDEQLQEVAGGVDMWCCRDVYGEEGDW